MQTGDPPNDAPLPDFLAAAARRPEGAAAHAVDAPDATGGAAGTDRPPRVLTLPAAPGPSGEAALVALPVTALTRRRLGWLAGVLAALWVLALFVRQVGDASAAQARADEIRRENEVLAAQVDALAAERELVEQDAWIAFEARAYGMGDRRERRFVLAPGAPSLAPDAPGSAALRVGRVVETRTPLESWLEVLFGPAR